MGTSTSWLAVNRLADPITRRWLLWGILWGATAFWFLYVGAWFVCILLGLRRRLRMHRLAWGAGTVVAVVLAGFAWMPHWTDVIAEQQRQEWVSQLKTRMGPLKVVKAVLDEQREGLAVAIGEAVRLRGRFWGVVPEQILPPSMQPGWYLHARVSELYAIRVWREADTRIALQRRLGARWERGHTHWTHAPQPTWQRWLGLPALVEINPDWVEGLNRVWDRTVRIPSPTVLLRKRPDRHPLMAQWARSRQTELRMILWWGLAIALFLSLLRATLQGRHSLLRNTILLGTWLGMGLTVQDPGLHWFWPSTFTVPRLSFLGTNLWRFEIGGITLLLWAWLGFFTVTLRERELTPTAYPWSWFWGFGLTMVGGLLVEWGEVALWDVMRVGYVEVLDVYAVSGFQRWVRWGVGFWTLGLVLSLWSGALWALTRGRYRVFGGVVGGGVVLSLLGLSQAALAIALLWGIAAILVWGIGRVRTGWAALAVGMLFYGLQPLFLVKSHQIRQEFIEQDWIALFQFRQTQAKADLMEAMKLTDRLLIALRPPTPHPSAAFFLWERLPFARSMGASSVVLQWWDTHGNPVAESRMDWQMPWWQPLEPIEPTTATWHQIRRVVYDGGPRTIQMAVRQIILETGILQITLAVAEDLYWAPWDARPDPIPSTLRMNETREFVKLLGPFRFGAWTRTGTAITETSWFFPQPLPAIPAGSWQTVETPYGERMAVYALAHPGVDVRVAIRQGMPLDVLERLAGLLVGDGVTLWAPFWLGFLIGPRRIRTPRFRNLIFAATLTAMTVFWLGVFGGLSVYLHQDIRDRFYEQTLRVARQAQTILQDYQALTGSQEINDALLHWVRRTLQRDVEVVGGNRVWATSRRAWYWMGLLPQVDSSPSQSVITVRLPRDAEGAVLRLPVTVDSYVLTFRLWYLAHRLLTGFVISLILSAGASYYLASRLVQPVQTIAGYIQSIEPPGLETPGPPPPLPQEFQPILIRFHALLEALRTYQAQARRAEQLAAWQEMARHVAHAVKNPLTPMQLALDQLRSWIARGDWSRLQTRLPGYLERLQKQVDALKRRVQEFAQYSQTITLRPQPVHLKTWMETLLQPYRVEAGPQFEWDVAEATDSPETAEIDPEWLGRAIQNIIENAIEAAGPRARIRIALRRVGDTVEIAIGNQGPPLPDDVVARIFDPAFTTKQYGSGLGLPLARRYVEMHGGTLDVENHPDGPVFILRLPARVPSENHA